MIPGYRLGGLLGRGASGSVYEGVQLSTGRPVALKVLDALVGDDRTADRFARERDAMAALATHPHVVAILDAGTSDGRPWLAMDLHRRGSLADAGPFPTTGAVTVLGGVADALATAHAHGIVHCDVKPANVLVDDAGRPVLGDFGIARLVLGTGQTGAAFTLDHAAPEVLDGGASPASDVWSLGTTVWQVLAGEPPFRRAEDASVAAVVRRIALEPLPPLDVDPELFALLVAMTAKDPADRPLASEVAAAVAGMRAEPLSPIATRRPSTGDTGTDHRPDPAALTGVAAPRLVPVSESRDDTGVRRRAPVIVGVLVAALLVAGSAGAALALWPSAPVPLPAAVAVPPAPKTVLPPPPSSSPAVAEVAEQPATTTRRRIPRSTTTSAQPGPVTPPPAQVAPPPVTTGNDGAGGNGGNNNGNNGGNNNGGDGGNNGGGGDLFPNGF